MVETQQLVSGADPEVALYDGIAFYESGEIYKALTCWKELLRLVPNHEIAQRYVEFVQGYLGVGQQFSEHDINAAQRRESNKLRGESASATPASGPAVQATGTAAFDPSAMQEAEAPPPPDSIRVRKGAAGFAASSGQGSSSATGTHMVAGFMVEDNAEDLIEEEVLTKKPDEALPVTLLASPVEQMAKSNIAKQAVKGESGPRTQADGLTVQALSRQLADFHRSGKYEQAVDTAKKLLSQDPQHAVARRYIDEYHRQKQAALQAALKKQKATGDQRTDNAEPKASITSTHLGAPGLNNNDKDIEDAPTAAPANLPSEVQESLISDFSHKPQVKMRPDQISWNAFDHRAGFFMSQVDGNTSYEDLIVISAMPREQALTILNQLVSNGVIG